jgi:peroxisomal enoyl-CoA hydratase 2
VSSSADRAADQQGLCAPVEVTRFRFPVERGKIAEFARSIGESDAVFFDPDEARSRGFPDVPAPLTYSVVSSHFAESSRIGGRYLAEELGMDMTRVVQGQHEWEYHRPLHAGMNLQATMSLVADQRKTGRRGGAMRVVVREIVYRDQSGAKVLTERLTAIETERTVGA